MIISSAWQADDAFITWRTVENAVIGHGLRWNPDERVLTYTHPLWMMVGILCRLIFGELYFSIIFVSIAISVGLALYVIWIARKRLSIGILAFWILITSRAFIDYSTSGLENPLLGLLIVAFAAAFIQRRAVSANATAALICLCRPDAVLLVAVPIGFMIWENRHAPKMLIKPALGWLPVFLWLAFSLVYYGSPVPNTAWAKLNVLIPREELLKQGIAYIGNSLESDPVTLLTILIASVSTLVLGNIRIKALAMGSLLFCLYVIWIGGDFMSGRFFYAPLVLSLISVVLMVLDREWSAPRASAGIIALLVSYWLLCPYSTLRVDGNATAEQPPLRQSGIADERRWYFRTTGLFNVLARRDELNSNKLPIPSTIGSLHGRLFRRSDVKVITYNAIGFFGYFAGPDRFIIDLWAVTDPLLSRIPYRPSGEWRIGHYNRALPPGYKQSRIENKNLIEDRALAIAYADILAVVNGPLWSGDRWQAIWRLNTGVYTDTFQKAAIETEALEPKDATRVSP